MSERPGAVLRGLYIHGIQAMSSSGVQSDYLRSRVVLEKRIKLGRRMTVISRDGTGTAKTQRGVRGDATQGGCEKQEIVASTDGHGGERVLARRDVYKFVGCCKL